MVVRSPGSRYGTCLATIRQGKIGPDGTVKLSRIRPFWGRYLLKPRPRIYDLEVVEGGENATKQLKLTIPYEIIDWSEAGVIRAVYEGAVADIDIRISLMV